MTGEREKRVDQSFLHKIHHNDRHLTDLISISLVTNSVAHNEEDNESEHRRHNDPPNDNDDGPPKKLGLHEVAAQVLWLCGKVDAANHPGGRQRCHLVVVDGQYAQIVVRASCQVVHQNVFTGGGYHSVEEKKLCELGRRLVECKQKGSETKRINHLNVIGMKRRDNNLSQGGLLRICLCTICSDIHSFHDITEIRVYLEASVCSKAAADKPYVLLTSKFI